MKPIQIFRSTLRCLLVAAAVGSALQAQAVVQGTWGSGTSAPQATGVPRTFTLNASEGRIIAADGVQIYMWGYGEGATGAMQYSGPTLKARVGDIVSVTLYNRLPVDTSIMFPGQLLTANIAANTSSTSMLATRVSPAVPAVPVTYTFTATKPGTYMYRSGTRPSLQTEMGLVGALVVYPNSVDGLKRAYDHAATAFDREHLIMVSEVDSALHTAVEDQLKTLRANNASCITGHSNCAIVANTAARFPDYWFLNGRTAPDVFARNSSVGEPGELVNQPYNTVLRAHPGEQVLLRMVGGGRDLHPMHHHGNNSWAIARDGRMLASTPTSGPDLGLSDYTIQIVPGQTYDALWSWSGKGLGWDIFGATCDVNAAVSATNCRFGKYDPAGVQTAAPACLEVANNPYPACPNGKYVSKQDPVTDFYKTIPVTLPSELELAFGEFYSGSPYLGDFGIKPTGAGAANTTGGFFHMFHSHNEREQVNGGVFPGGMMTMLVIEPFSVSIDAGQP
jgi:FtsP/CotA-like multicopper oxidase with cupredoxin domain